MAYTKITRTNNGRKAIEYAKGNGKGHNGKKDRNECISTVNMLDGIDPVIQMQKYWLRASKNHMVQVNGIIQSFSRNEFDPINENDILTVNTIGVEYAETHFPGRQCMVFTQTDGKSGLLHNHILINDVHMETNKGCDKKQYFWPQLTKWTDEITRKYTDLDFGEKSNNKMSQTERAKRELGKYVWKDDLKERVKKSIEEATSEEDFLERLEANGLGVREGKSKIHGKYFTYELKDLSKVPKDVKLPNRKLKARSYKLGEDFGYEALEIKLKNKRKKLEKDFVEVKEETKKDELERKTLVDEISIRATEKINVRKYEEEAELNRKEKYKKTEAIKLHNKRSKSENGFQKNFDESIKSDVDYSKCVKKDNQILEESYEKIKRNKINLRAEIERDSNKSKNNKKYLERLMKINKLMSNIQQKQDDGMEYY